MSIDVYVVGALAVLTASTGSSGSVPDAEPRILSDEALACVWVHIGEDLKYSHDPPDKADQYATIGLMVEISRLLRAGGYSTYAANGREVVTPSFGVSAPNPRCKSTTAYRATVTYEPLPKRDSFRATVSIKYQGKPVLFEQNDFDFSALPQALKANPLQVYMIEDMKSKAIRILQVFLNSAR